MLRHPENFTSKQKTLNNTKRWECLPLSLLVTLCASHLMMRRHIQEAKNHVGDGGKERLSGRFSLKMTVSAACTECSSETFYHSSHHLALFAIC